MNTTEHNIHVVHTLMLCQYEIADEARALGLWRFSLNIQRRYCYWMYSKIAAKTVDIDQGVHTSSEPSHTPTQRAMHIAQTSMQSCKTTGHHIIILLTSMLVTAHEVEMAS